MKKKRLLLLLLVVLVAFSFVGCKTKYTPDPAVEQYLNTGLTAEQAYESISSVSYVEKRTNEDKQGNVKGTLVSRVEMDKSDPNNLTLTINQKFEGEYVENNVVELTSTLQKVNGKYVYSVTTSYSNVVSSAKTDKEMSDEDAEALVKGVVYTNNDAYDLGLYYGDLFMLNIYQYPADFFYVDTEENLCVFDGKIYVKNDNTGDMKLFQTTKINELGLLVYSFERYESVPNDNVMTCEITPIYQYVTTAQQP